MYHLNEKEICLPEKVLDGLQTMGRKLDLSRIILFGSRARGTNGERSDIDLAIYAEDVKQYYEILDEIQRDGVILYEKV